MTVLVVVVTETSFEVVGQVSLRRLLCSSDDVWGIASKFLTADLPARVTLGQLEWSRCSEARITAALALK
jgi:hypothetical protein